VGRIGRIEEKDPVGLETLPREYAQFKHLFQPKASEKMPLRRTFDHAIDLKEGSKPPWGPVYPMLQYQLNTLKTYLDEMLAQGTITHSQSPAGAPILFVPKPDCRLRLCVDYRQLNKLTILNKYPLPLMSELRDRVAGATIFTKLDLKDGYHLIRIKKGDEWKTVFRTRYGQYAYKVMPFGLVNAPTTFQRMMNKILREFLDQGVVVYLDDIVIYSKTHAGHVTMVKKVLSRLMEHQLAVSIKKSEFHVKAVEFLGYIVATDGVTMSMRKVDSIRKWKAPRSVKEVQTFLGFAYFYRRFIENFSKICKSIRETLKGDKQKFSWGQEQNIAFEKLKWWFTTAPVLAYFYPERETVIETDASDFALGAILSQFQDKRLHPVAFHSPKLNSAELNYEIYDKELLAILEAFMEWKHYLYGADKPIMVYTDHQNLQHFLMTKKWNPRQIRWAQLLASFNFKIVYRPGSRSGKPDALSRPPEYRPEEGAEHTEQSILKPEHFSLSLVQDKPVQEKLTRRILVQQAAAIQVMKMAAKAKLPSRGSRFSAGHDLYALEDVLTPASGQRLIGTGIAIGIPQGTYARIAPRSGLAYKESIGIGGGVIDADYTGEVKVIMMNHGKKSYKVQEGDRIAQMIIEKIDMLGTMEVDNVQITDRVNKGFGSIDLSPKQTIAVEQVQPIMCQLYADSRENRLFSENDIGRNPWLLQEGVMVSSAMISKALLQEYELELLEEVREASRNDLEWLSREATLNDLITCGKKLPTNWQYKDWFPYFKNRLYILANDALKTKIAKGCHDSKVAGHFGMEKKIEIIMRDLYWKGLTEWINNYVQSCNECQYNKSPQHERWGLLQPLETPYAAWNSISTNFITQLPESQGYTQIMVVVDHFTKMAHFIGLPTNATAKDVANVFLREVSKLYGLPTEIISDMDAKFSGDFWESLCKLLGIKRKMSTAYHPQTDDQTERTNQVLEGYLRNFVTYDQDDWYQLLPLAKFAYNNSTTNAHGMSPFFANYGYHPQTKWMRERQAQNPGAELYSHLMKAIHKQAVEALNYTREAMKRYYDQKALQQPDYKEGYLVMLNGKNICTKRPSKKSSPKLYGPFKIIVAKGQHAFKLEISPT